MANKPNVSRRMFLSGMTGMTASQAFSKNNKATTPGTPCLTFGVVTDCHYADIDHRGTRYYRESDEKLARCIREMNQQRVDFMIELGDFKDQGATANQTLTYLRSIESVYAQFTGPRYHVLGNHDMDRISKTQFLEVCRNPGIDQDKSFYAFDCRGYHAVVLDANYLKDGTDYNAGNFDWTETFVPEHELIWLEKDLAATRLPVIVFIHQLLDGDQGNLYVKNAARVRQVLESSRRVRAVFQGHHHAGGYSLRAGIHYYTLRGMIEGHGMENSAFAVVDTRADGSLNVHGHIKARSRHLACPVNQKGMA